MRLYYQQDNQDDGKVKTMIDKKDRLYACGKVMFCSKGFKKTNVSEITRAAGMATGTFYNYYSSKDKLFMDIYIDENARLKKSIIESLDLTVAPGVVIKEMMSKNLQGMMENPILQHWYDKEVFQKIEQCWREESGLDQLDFMYEGFFDIVKNWQNEGRMRNDISPEMIMAIFGALVNVDTHKEEIGVKYFPEVLEYLTEFTLKGLTDTGYNSAT